MFDVLLCVVIIMMCYYYLHIFYNILNEVYFQINKSGKAKRERLNNTRN